MTDDQRGDALELIASIGASAGWLNKLDRLFAVVCDAAVDLPSSPQRDHLLAGIDAFTLEFHGDDQGADHPDAIAVSTEPRDEPEQPSAPVALDEIKTTGIPANAVLLIVGFPLDLEGEWTDKHQAHYDKMHGIATALRDTFSEPRPFLVVNPNNELTVTALTPEDMDAMGWKPK